MVDRSTRARHRLERDGEKHAARVIELSPGHYSSKSDLVKDVPRALLSEKRNLRPAAAVELHRRNDLSPGKAASR